MNRRFDSHALRSCARGQSLVEFALVLPLLLVLAFMITEFGRALWIKNLLTGAAGNAARVVIVSGSDTYQAAADSAVNHFLAGAHLGTEDGTTVEVEFIPTGDPGTADLVKVTLSRPFSFIPGGGDGGELPTNPGGQGPFIQLATINIVGDATMDLQPSFQRHVE
jgi:Flp pilus assembly protein TadG